MIPAGTGRREFDRLIVGAKDDFDRIAAERELAELGETLETPAPRKTKKKKAAPAPAPAPVVESETVVLTSDAIVEP